MSTRSITRLLVAATIAATLAPASAYALQSFEPAPLDLPSSTTSLAKPPVAPHADVVPRVPGGAAGSVKVVGPVLPALSVPRPDGSGTGMTHPIDLTSSSGSGLPLRSLDGANKISFGSFRDGDMVVVEDIASVTGHAGLFDNRYYSDIHSFALWSANVVPVNGVQREPCLKYRAFDCAYALWVPGEADHRVAARNFAARQVGKPYSVFASKTDLRSFYCSKLAWASWHYTSGLDLDGDGGFWVWPVNLVNSRYTKVFGYWN